jgi:hypothetical protein
MMAFSGTMGSDRWPSVSQAIYAGKHSNVASKLTKCVPKTVEWVPMFEYHRGDIPLAWLVAKAAFESCGDPEAGQDRMTDIGLFQLFPVHLTNRGYTPADGLDPDVNTRIMTDLVMSRGESFESSHPSYFPSGRDWSYWGVAWLAAAIGPGATRHLLNQISSGGSSFSRLCSFVEHHPAWMEQPEQEDNWGNQSGRLVAFRVMVARDVMRRIQELEDSRELLGYVRPYYPSDGAEPGGISMGRAVRIIGIILGSAATASCAGLIGWLVYTRRRAS